jgi:hypothetical protein
MTYRSTRPNVVSEESVFDLPIEKQHELAKLEGYASFEDWVADTEKMLKAADEFARQADEAIAARKEGELPEGWTQDTLDNWIAKGSYYQD